MVLKKLKLVNFRNYSNKEFQFSSGVNLIVGPNAIGKTNLLESIYLLGTGNSFKATRNEEMILWDEKLAMVEGKFEEVDLKVALEKDDQRTSKQFWIDKTKKTRRLFLDALSVVIFRPEEIRIISGSPSRRREFLDDIIGPCDWEYYRSLRAYEKALKRRNSLLDEIRERKADKQELFFWDKALAKNGEVVRIKREQFLDFANNFFKTFENGRFSHFSCSYQSSPVTAELLTENLREDLARGSTGIGPHRDDFTALSSKFKTEEKDLASWGSRGQQRLAVLILKLAQLAFIESIREEKPLLLLDDLFSELDNQGQELTSSLLDDYQTFLTSASSPAFLKNANLINL